MSLLWLFRKFVDPVGHAVEERDRHIKREVKPADEAKDDPPPPLARCRICSYESTSREYCPSCLADTMEIVAK
jgi:hypothetical protein